MKNNKNAKGKHLRHSELQANHPIHAHHVTVPNDKNPDGINISLNKNVLSNSHLIIRKNHRKCDNIVCSVVSSKQTTSLNKWSKFKISNGDVIWLCTLCSDAFLKKQYCYYCYSIYSEEIHDGKEWIECDYCKLWHHCACEENYGNFKDISKQVHDKSFKYKCPVCIKNEEDQEKKLSKNIASPKKKIIPVKTKSQSSANKSKSY